MLSPESPSCTGGLLLPKFTRFYFHYSRKAFNMAQYLTREMQFDDSVFHSALCYWHSFIDIHGLKVVNEVILIAACVFLAAKVAHYKFQARRLVILAFDLGGGGPPRNSLLRATTASPVQGQPNPQSLGRAEEEEAEDEETWMRRKREEEVASWQAVLLDVELLLCDTLQFNFHIPNPCAGMEDLIVRCAHQHGLTDDDDNTRRRPQTPLLVEEARRFVASLIARVKRIHIFLLISPLSSQLSPEDCSAALVYLVLHYSLVSREREQATTSAASSTAPRHGAESGACGGESDAMNKVVTLQRALESFAVRVRGELRLPDQSVVEGVLGVIIETFHYMRKSTDIPALDELVEAHTRASPVTNNTNSIPSMGSPTWR